MCARLRCKTKIQVYIRWISVSTTKAVCHEDLVYPTVLLYIDYFSDQSYVYTYEEEGGGEGGWKGVRCVRRVAEAMICDKARLWPCTNAFVQLLSVFAKSSIRVTLQQ